MSADEIDPKPEDKPKSASRWLAMLKDAESADRYYHEQVDAIDKRYAELKKLSTRAGNRQLQLLWANLEVMKPTVYSRPPQPVVQPRFKDRKELPRKAGDVMERALISDVEADDLHDTLLLGRDDLCVAARGVVWLTDGERDGVPVAMAEHLDRKDWRCEPSRKWSEVGWVARRAFMDRREVKDRFKEVPPTMKFEKRKVGDFMGEKKASVWEIWHKADNCVVWVSEDVEDVLDKREPHLKLTRFFPCPKPAYGTLERGTLTPIPDPVYYLDQLEEINDTTARIAALTDAVKMRGFYPAGTSDVAEAIETAFKSLDDRAMMTPINSLSSLGPNVSLKDAILWLPVVEVMTTIQGLIEIRRQLIEDVYQITGLSDIMRGSTDPNETLGAQELKSQYGSVRVREKQAEMQRLSRDVIRLKGEIMAENVPIDALMEMAQVDDIPRKADIEKQAQQIQQQCQQQIEQLVQQAMQAQQQSPQQPQGMPMQ
jgi:hypothetical protein